MADSQHGSASGGRDRWTGEGPGESPSDEPGAGARHNAPDDWTRALGGGEQECLDWCPICRGADVLRATASPEIREQWNQVQREALVTLRALIDHYIEHLEDRPRRA